MWQSHQFKSNNFMFMTKSNNIPDTQQYNIWKKRIKGLYFTRKRKPAQFWLFNAVTFTDFFVEAINIRSELQYKRRAK